MANGHKRGNYSYELVESVTFRKNIGGRRFSTVGMMVGQLALL